MNKFNTNHLKSTDFFVIVDFEDLILPITSQNELIAKYPKIGKILAAKKAFDESAFQFKFCPCKVFHDPNLGSNYMPAIAFTIQTGLFWARIAYLTVIPSKTQIVMVFDNDLEVVYAKLIDTLFEIDQVKTIDYFIFSDKIVFEREKSRLCEKARLLSKGEVWIDIT